jgi:hypothetical protein
VGHASSLSHTLLIDDFNRSYTRNYANGELTSGVASDSANTPMIFDTRIVRDDKGASFLRVEYDIPTGSAFVSVGIENTTLLSRYSGISFFVRGTASTITLQLVGDDTYEYAVRNISESWTKVTIPYSSFSFFHNFDPSKIREIRFVIDSEKAEKKNGRLYIDDLELFFEKQKEKRSEKRIAPPEVQRVNGKRFYLKAFQAGVLTLEARVKAPYIQSEVLQVRFEASSDKKHWFYVGDGHEVSGTSYVTHWDARYFESGKYFVRSVALSSCGEKWIGAPRLVQIHNPFEIAALVEKVHRAGFEYFLSERSETKGIIKDTNAPDSLFSTRASAFGILAYCIGAKRGYISRIEAAESVRRIIDFFKNELITYSGFFPPFFDYQGKEIMAYDYGDVPDTALFLASALIAREYFSNDSDVENYIRDAVIDIYAQVDWRQIYIQTETRTLLYSQIFKGEKRMGVLEKHGEGMLPFILAIASPSFRISPDSWDAQSLLYAIYEYDGYTVFGKTSLYNRLLPSIFLDFKKIESPAFSYINDVKHAVLRNREYCLKKSVYPPGLWGITPCIGPEGFRSYAVPYAEDDDLNDGTLCPSVAISTVGVLPTLGSEALQAFYENYSDVAWGEYGFFEAINPAKKYYKNVYTAHGLGALLSHIENEEAHFIHDLFMKSSSMRKALKRIGLYE